ncbi:hypothetical protein LJC71_09135 [Desulfosarcina sp. OttesenSCG-928-A07]|nr:hypothetical protein [Desulfosarcina sp. OttesenSCG-928-G17]MDL2329888.1 hypothetical protein [Desulfosarcina sp. OttesenSCG-928-A07]
MMKFIGIVVQEVLLFLFWFIIVTNFIPMADTAFYALVVIFLCLPLVHQKNRTKRVMASVFPKNAKNARRPSETGVWTER